MEQWSKCEPGDRMVHYIPCTLLRMAKLMAYIDSIIRMDNRPMNIPVMKVNNMVRIVSGLTMVNYDAKVITNMARDMVSGPMMMAV